MWLPRFFRRALLDYDFRFFLGDLAGVFPGVVHGAPHIPTGDGAIGTPAFAEFGKLARFGNRFFAIGEGETFLHAVIMNRQHVRASQTENQEHLDGPGADAANGDEPVNKFPIGEFHGVFERGDNALNRFGGQIANGGDFGFGKPRFAKSVKFREKDFFRRGADAVGAERADAVKDYFGGFSGDALIDDGAQEGFVGSFGIAQVQFELGFFDEASEASVGFREMGNGSQVVEWVGRIFGHGERTGYRRAGCSTTWQEAVEKQGEGAASQREYLPRVNQRGGRRFAPLYLHCWS